MISPAEHVAIAEIAVRRKLGRGLTPGEIEQLTEDYKELSAAARPENTQRAPFRAQEKIMSKKIEKRVGKGVFTNLIHGDEPEAVRKDAKNFMPGTMGGPNVEEDTTPDNVGDRLVGFAGRSEDATVDPEWLATQWPEGHRPFAGDNHGDLADATPAPYDLHGAGNATPHLLNFVPEGQGEMFSPAPFVAPVPGVRPQGPALPDMDNDEDDLDAPIFARKGVKLGTASYILKSQIDGA